MLIYSDKLEKHIIKKILPKILLVKGDYLIREQDLKQTYLTNINIIQMAYPDVNQSNVYDSFKKLIKKIMDEKDIFIIQIQCGTDDRFKLTSSEKIKTIKSLLNDNEKEQFNYIIKKYKLDPDKQLLFANEFLEPLYHLNWSVDEIMNNKKKLRGNQQITFTQTITQNMYFIIEYLVKIGTHLININPMIIYQSYTDKITDMLEILYQLKLSVPSEKDYYSLYLLENYYRSENNESTANEINQILNQVLGMYQQLISTIDGYLWLQENKKLDIEFAKKIVINILNDLPYVQDFKSNIYDKLQDVAIDNTPDAKIRQWGILLSVLRSELNFNLNSISKGYFDHYYELLTPYNRKAFYKKIKLI